MKRIVSILVLVLLVLSLPQVEGQTAGETRLVRNNNAVFDYSLSDLFFEIDYREDPVATFTDGNRIYIVTSSRLYVVDPAGPSVEANITLPPVMVSHAVFDGLGVLYVASSEYADGGYITRLAAIDTGSLETVWEHTLDGDPVALGANNDGIVALAVAGPDRLYLYTFALGELAWNYSIPPAFVDPDTVDYSVVAVQPGGGMVAWAFQAYRNVSLLLFSENGTLLYKDVVERSETSKIITAVWSPDGKVLYYQTWEDGDYILVALDVERMEVVWKKILGIEDPSWDPLVNPTGCCLYLFDPGFEDRLVVVNASDGRIISLENYGPMLALHPSGVLGVAVSERPTGIDEVFIEDKYGYAGVFLSSFPLNHWEGRVYADIMVLGAGWLADDRFYVVTMLGDKVRVSVFDWGKYGVVYLDPGVYADYYSSLGVVREVGDQVESAAGRAFFVRPGPAMTVQLYAVPSPAGKRVETPLGVEGSLVGNMSLQEERFWQANITLTIPDIEPITAVVLDIEDILAPYWTHLVAATWPECPFSGARVEDSTGGSWEPTFTRGSQAVYALVSNVTYTFTFTLEATDRTLFGTPPERSFTITAEPGAVVELFVPNWSRLGLTGLGDVYLYPPGGGEREWIILTNSTVWEYYCLPPGEYRAILRPALLTGGPLLAPDDWELETTISLQPGAETRVNITRAFLDRVAILTVVNTADQEYVVSFAVNVDGTRQGLVAYVLGPGDEMNFTVLVGWHYIIGYEPNMAEGETGTIELTIDTPGTVTVVEIPEGTPQTITTTPPQPQQPAGQTGVTGTPTPAETTTTAGTGTTGEATAGEGEGGAPTLAVAAVGAVVIVAALAYLLLLRK